MKSKATTYKAEILALWGENETRVKDIAALAARLDDLESIMVNVVVDESDHQVRLHKLETVGATNDRIFAELLGDSAEFAARLDALSLRVSLSRDNYDALLENQRQFMARLDKLETADLHWEDLVDARLDALEQAVIDQARNSNASAIAAKDERAALATRIEFLGESRDRQNDNSTALVCRVNALEAELNGLRDIISATLNRLAELENPPLLGPARTGEWVRGNGLLPSDVLDGSRGGGE